MRNFLIIFIFISTDYFYYTLVRKKLKMLVLIEGSLYWKGYQFKEMVNQKLLELGMDLNNLKIDQTRKIGLKGAARLVLAG